MTGVTAEINLSIRSRLTGANDLGTPDISVNIEEVLRLVEGTGATSQADKLFSDTRAIAISSTEDLDLAGGLTDAFGAAITLAEVVAVYIKAAAANVTDILVGNAATNAFVGPLGATGVQTVKPGEYLLWQSKTGWPVIAGTGDLLKVANGGATLANYDIVVIGRTGAA